MRHASALAVLALVLVGCSGDDGEISQQEVRRLVVLPADLPDEFVRFDQGRLVRSDAPRGERGWKARYRRPGGPETAGPLVVDSRVEVYESEDAARAGVDFYREDVSTAESLDEPELGDDGYAATLVQQGGSSGVRFFFLGWRQGETTAILSVSGFDGRLRVEDALALARAQAGRIDAARAD